MTNKDRILTLPTKQCITELRKVFRSQALPYIDLEQWFDSENADLLPRGTRGIYEITYGLDGSKNQVDAIACEDRHICGQPYVVLYVLDNNGGGGQLTSVPRDMCKLIKAKKACS